MNNIEKLLSISSDELCTNISPSEDKNNHLKNQLFNILKIKNGFYAFEGALHFFPENSYQEEIGLHDWNNSNVWIGHYEQKIEDTIFFAEDIFGCQFCIHSNKIYSFDPETITFDYLSDDFEGWAEQILNDYNVLTGYSLGKEWQEENGKLGINERLVPIIPFVLGGEYEVSNLHSIDRIKGMRLRAEIANQISSIPDGSNVQFTLGK